MSSPRIQKLISLLSKLPGLGPRQSARLIYHILDQGPELTMKLSKNLAELHAVKRCSSCFQTHEESGYECYICRSESRDRSLLMIIEKDTDLDTLEKTGVYNGRYFILGGIISPLGEVSRKRLRLNELVNLVSSSKDIKEIILGTSSTAEGDLTARYVEKILEQHVTKSGIKLTRLGRGLSTGIELEFSDTDTFKNAYINRK